ncbi:MAG: hypothetical protein LKF69_05560 [Bacilli bacterium]|jgi:hypothetical protein|nr:hypothetical protein [Bacilli bacterium]MCH4236239.1 hypothetical protein [Bacilli bacterium]
MGMMFVSLNFRTLKEEFDNLKLKNVDSNVLHRQKVNDYLLPFFSFPETFALPFLLDEYGWRYFLVSEEKKKATLFYRRSLLEVAILAEILRNFGFLSNQDSLLLLKKCEQDWNKGTKEKFIFVDSNGGDFFRMENFSTCQNQRFLSNLDLMREYYHTAAVSIITNFGYAESDIVWLQMQKLDTIRTFIEKEFKGEHL